MVETPNLIHSYTSMAIPKGWHSIYLTEADGSYLQKGDGLILIDSDSIEIIKKKSNASLKHAMIRIFSI